MSNSGIPPWHMWGGSAGAILNQANTGHVAAQQLATIRYKRPENWQFIFTAEILQGAFWTAGGQVQVAFDLTIGVGRAVMVLRQFVLFGMTLPAGAPSPGLSRLTATCFPGNLNDAPVIAGTPFNSICAETINCSVRIDVNGALVAPADTIAVNATALFAPSTHVRPEWYLGQFPGGEGGGS